MSSKDSKQAKFSHLPLSTSGPQDCSVTGTALLRSPYHNKGSAFPLNERLEFKLYGLLPSNVQTLESQVERAYEQYSSQNDPLAKNTFMTSMKDQNVVLYYKLLQSHLKEMFSIIYTPTEGEAIENFSNLFRRPEGCFLNIFEQDRVYDNLSLWGRPNDIDYIVVTDGEEILGIGDQGVGGVLISTAKLVLTTLCAGIHPSRTLPVVLDCGTDNQKLLDDELYLGLRQPRVRGKDYDQFVDGFIQAAQKLYPRAYVHFEDFGLKNAKRILDKYRPEIACFNDDIQGTGCITLAAIMSGLHISKLKLADMKMIIFGSGTAGIGIADQVRDVIVVETGKPKEEAVKQIWCVDRPGLLLKSQVENLTHGQIQYARNDAEWSKKKCGDLLSVVREVKPHVLTGTSTCPKAFTEEIVKEMAKHVERPMIFPLSNPTRLHEADPKDLSEWTKGKALIATGSPFPPVEYDGQQYEVAECNNSTAFPGIGLGAVLCRSRLLSDKMLVAAVKVIAAQSPALKDPTKGLVPDVVNVREISVHIAKAVIKQAVDEGLAREKEIPGDDGDLEEWVREQMWEPRYLDQMTRNLPFRRDLAQLLERAGAHDFQDADVEPESLFPPATQLDRPQRVDSDSRQAQGDVDGFFVGFHHGLEHLLSQRERERDHEPVMKGYVDLLMKRLQGLAAAGTSADMVQWYNFTTFDLVGDMAIGKPFGCLNDSRCHEWVSGIWKSIEVGPYIRAMASYTNIQLLMLLLAPKAIRNARAQHVNYVRANAQERVNNGVMEERRDFLSYMLKNKGEAEALTGKEIAANCGFLILAGSETTATALSGVTYHLLKVPAALQTIADEVRNAFASEDEINFINASARLPNTLACLTEVLRVYPPGPTLAPRRTPKGCTTDIAGYQVPSDTSVGVHSLSAARCETSFHRPKDFLPDRRLPSATADPASAFHADRRGASQPFSLGPRNCLGKSLAYNEMRVILARMLWNFDLELCSESEAWHRQLTYTLWEKPPLMCRLRDVRAGLAA